MVKTILVTGGAGFVGSALATQLKAKHVDYRIIALDNLKRRGSELNLLRLNEFGVEFFHGDVRNAEDFRALPQIDTIIDASAEPSVLAGIGGSPEYVVNTNLMGTINCLNFALRDASKFVFLSTSRVYPIEKIDQISFNESETRFEISPDQKIPGIDERGINESFSLEGYRSIYGATKLCSELLIAEYAKFYGLKTVINRCGVLTGPWQMGKADQGVVVLWLARHFWNKELSYIGYGGGGKQVRDVLHINDLCRLVDAQISDIDVVNGEIFNVGGGRETSVSLLELTKLCEKITGNSIPIHSQSENRDADIRIYLTDNAKVTSVTKWKPEIGVEEILIDTFNWLKSNQASLELILS